MQDNLINYKVYLAGQHAPAMSVTAQQGIFQFSEAKIELFPHKELVNFGEGDRVPVQIFFLDTFSSATEVEYKLMFEGEVKDVMYTRSPSSISMSVSAVSPFEILGQIFVSFFSDLTNKWYSETKGEISVKDSFNIKSLLGDDLTSNLADTGVTLKTTFDKLISTKFLVERSKVLTSSQSYKYMRRPYVLLRNILMDLINGMYSQVELRKDISLFLRSFISRKSILKSMFASPILEDIDMVNGKKTANLILNAIDNADTIDALVVGISRLMKAIGQSDTVSYWDIITRIYSIIMYEVIMPLCPPYIKSNILGVPSTDETKYTGIMHLLTKPSINFGVPLLSNTIFPCMISSISYTNAHATRPTRFYLKNPSIIDKLSGRISQGDTEKIMSFLNFSTAVWPRDLEYTSTKDKATDQGTSTTIPTRVTAPQTKDLAVNIRKKLLWDADGKYHEFFTGPIVKMDLQAPDWVNFIKKYITVVQDEKSSESTDVSNKYLEKVGYDIQDILYLYAQNEFEKEGASRHNLAVELKFNPFIVPGFPVAIIDNIQYGSYFLAMPIRVLHHLSNGGAATSVQLTNVISFKDAYNIKKSKGFDVGPSNPSPQVSEIFNVNTKASEYYKSVFYQGVTKPTYIFKPEDYFFLDANKEIELKVDGSYKGLLPGVKSTALDYVQDYTKAMRYISRPIATLAEYMEFKKTNVVAGENSGAVYYNSTNGSNLFNTTGNATVSESIFPHGGTTHYRRPMLFNGSELSQNVTRNALKVDIDPKREIISKAPIYYEKILGFTYLKQTKADGTRLFKNKPTSISNHPDFLDDWASKIENYRKDILNTLQDFYIG